MTLHTDKKEYWKSLEQLDGSPEFKKFLDSEFPLVAEDGADSTFSRRKFLSIMGASFALAGLTSCRRPVEAIVPHVMPPEDIALGVPVEYHTTMPNGIHAYGLTVRTYDGRPIKIEGNPAHPSTQGASNSFIQAEILNLYDPDRSKSVLNNSAERSWDDFVVFWRGLLQKYSHNNGDGLAIISPSFSDPTQKRQALELKKKMPKMHWVVYDPISDENIYKGIKAATGRDLIPLLSYDKAKVILSIDSDFLFLERENLSQARGFAAGRKMSSHVDELNRLYVVESAVSVTGAAADHRLALHSSQVGAFVGALAVELTALGLAVKGTAQIEAGIRNHFDAKWLRAVAEDLLAHFGQSIVAAGRSQSIAVHALVLAINSALGNIGKTVDYRLAEDDFLPDGAELAKLKYRMDNGEISTLIVMNSNPVYDSPVALDFAKVENIIHFGEHVNETGDDAHWHVPKAHFLESWGDAKSVDATLSIIQPMIKPLYSDAKSLVEFLQLLASGEDKRGYEIVRQTWQSILPRRDFEKAWRKTLHDGLAQNTAIQFRPAVRDTGVSTALAYYSLLGDDSGRNSLSLVLQASSQTFDGRYANNGWLLENPHPITKLVWDNAALVSPETAAKLGVKNNDVLQVSVNKKSVELPVWIVPGQANNVIVVELGFGRTVAGRVGDNIGVNVYPLRDQVNLFALTKASAKKIDRTYKLTSTQNHGSMEGRPLVREATLQEYKEHPEFAKEAVEHPPLQSLWKEQKYDKGNQWGMTIDLNSCIGCGACTVACQSENNIAIVGKKQVSHGREMHWIRVDRYFTGNPQKPDFVHQPVACHHCEMAPCESVCPVAATVHDSEGLNVMVYNRCVGTRYCSNNCPYKVRRFNFFNYIKDYPETIKMAQNPNVTVRSRGVMEKCTYCLQRINEGKRKAKDEGRELHDGEIQTACQQACPTQAITFGNILDKESKVAKSKELDRNYGMLGELNLKPRTSYLAKVRNPNPKLLEKSGS